MEETDYETGQRIISPNIVVVGRQSVEDSKRPSNQRRRNDKEVYARQHNRNMFACIPRDQKP
jgi:hypothetical protein